MNRILKHIFLFSVLLALSLWYGETGAQENYIIRRIEFTGNEFFSSGTLLDQLSIYATGKFQQLILRKKPYYYSKEIFESDLKKLVRFYQREGFLKVKVSSEKFALDIENKTFKLRINLIEGQFIKVSKVDYALSNEQEPGRDELITAITEIWESLNIKEGNRFRDEEVINDQGLLTEVLLNSGYPYVKVYPELRVDTTVNAVEIKWNIESGPRCFFGAVSINGDNYVSESTVTRQLAFRQGEVYKQKSLDKTQEQVYALGVYQIVTVKSQLTKSEEQVIPVEIQLKEAPRFGVKFGIGYGREDEFRVFSDFRYFGFLGGGRRLNLFIKHSGLEPYNIDLKLTQPALFTPRTSLVLNPYVLRQEEPGYTVNRVGGSSTLMHKLTHNLSSSATYSFEQTKLDTTTVAEEEDAEDLIPEVYNKSSIIFGLTWDNSTPMFTPRGGIFSAMVFKWSGLGFDSDFHYTRLMFDGRKYIGLWKTVFALRIKVGGINSMDEHDIVPVEDRFYSGGSNSVRGWSRSKLGPLDDDDVPIGGKSLLEGSTELRYPIIGLLSGVVFMDFGNVWLDSYSYQLEELRYAAGLGLRFETPIGPVRLDVASPVWDEDKKVQLHISVGQAF